MLQIARKTSSCDIAVGISGLVVNSKVYVDHRFWQFNKQIPSSFLACDVCLGQKDKICATHGPLKSLPCLKAEDHGIGSNIGATYAMMSFPDEVQLCTSSIPGYVYGVCARRHLPSGTWIGPYEGRRTVDQRNNACEIQDYFWEVLIFLFQLR